MKKFTAVLMICLLILSLAACGTAGGGTSGGPSVPPEQTDDGGQSEGGDSQAPDGSDTEGEGSSGTPVSPSSVATNTDHGEFDGFAIDIEEAVLTQDGDGNPALAVTFTWTNNSEETLSAWDVWQFYAYQDGIQVDTTWVFDNPDVTLDDKDTTRIRPGTSLTFQKVFSLFNDVSDVEVEVEQWYDYKQDPGVIAACTYVLP